MECNWDHFFTKTFVAILAYVTTIEKTLIHKKLAFLLQIFGPNPRAIGISYISQVDETIYEENRIFVHMSHL